MEHGYKASHQDNTRRIRGYRKYADYIEEFPDTSKSTTKTDNMCRIYCNTLPVTENCK